MTRREHAEQSAREIAVERYPDALAVFLAGSVLRGEDTPSSDLDLVVIYERLPRARRESFKKNNWPVESFLNDPETLTYFIEEADFKSATPIMATMISEGICVAGNSTWATQLQNRIRKYLSKGPGPLTQKEIDRYRYGITDSVDDIRHPKSKAELQASATILYSLISDVYFRSQGLWCARRKMIPRKLKEVDAAFAARFIEAFDTLFSAGDSSKTLLLAEEVLMPLGGFLFDGYKSDASDSARSQREARDALAESELRQLS